MRKPMIRNRKRPGVMFMLLAVMLLLPLSCAQLEEMDEFRANPDITTPDLQQIPDGVYAGEFKSGLVRASVEVSVKSHWIHGITILEHDNMKGEPAESITERVIQAQTLDVSAVSGATMSSLVILKAVETALEQ